MTILVAIGFIMLQLIQLVWIPTHAAFIGPWVYWFLVPTAFTNNTLWALIHEGVHGNLPRPLARLLSIFFGAPFDVLRAGHLAHHRLNRSPGDQPDRESLPRYFFNLFGGLYLSEVVAGWLPLKTILRATNYSSFGMVFVGLMAVRRNVIRADALAVLVVYGFAFWLYGPAWPFLAAALVARAFFISWLDYIYHYDTPTGDVLHAKDLWLPYPLNRMILNFNLHHVHHRSPSTPWHLLPLAPHSFDGSYLRAALAVLRGPARVAALVVAAALAIGGLSGCEGLSGYDRSYYLSYQTADGQEIRTGATFSKQRGDGKSFAPPKYQ